MYRFLLTPRWLLLHLVMVVAVLACLALGRWQWDTYQDSSSQQALRERAPEPITEVLEPGQPLEDAANRPITVGGSYQEPIVVPDRVRDGVLGTYQAASFTNEHGRLVVLRGWSETPDAQPDLPDGHVQLTGHLLPAETANDATAPEAAAASPGHLNYLDPALLDEAVGSGGPDYAGYLLLSDEEPGGLGNVERLDVDAIAPVNDVNPWQNFSYWAQWWVFAGAAIVFWASFVRAGVRARRAAGDPTDTEADEVTAPERFAEPFG